MNLFYWPGRVVRADGFQVELLDDTIDLAAERISAACQQIGLEIDQQLGLPLGTDRKKYGLTEPTSKDGAEPPLELRPPCKQAHHLEHSSIIPNGHGFVAARGARPGGEHTRAHDGVFQLRGGRTPSGRRSVAPRDDH